MLRQINCEIFNQKHIEFHKGLNAVVGDNSATNSIGKSYMLMIIDFIFGGHDYIEKCNDVIDEFGNHHFSFSFEFNETEYFFVRKTDDLKNIYKCDKTFNILSQITLDDYLLFLKENYNCNIEDMRFRNIIGRYLRIYRRGNTNEDRPLKYSGEKDADALKYLIILFDRYGEIVAFEKLVKELKAEKKIMTEASQKNLITLITTKNKFVENEKRILDLESEIKNAEMAMTYDTADIKKLISENVHNIQKENSKLNIECDRLKSRLKRTSINLQNKNIDIKAELDLLSKYFSDFNRSAIEELDDFHKGITIILKEEIGKTKKELEKNIDILLQCIEDNNKKIKEALKITEAPQYVINTVIDKTYEINTLRKQN